MAVFRGVGRMQAPECVSKPRVTQSMDASGVCAEMSLPEGFFKLEMLACVSLELREGQIQCLALAIGSDLACEAIE